VANRTDRINHGNFLIDLGATNYMRQSTIYSQHTAGHAAV